MPASDFTVTQKPTTSEVEDFKAPTDDEDTQRQEAATDEIVPVPVEQAKSNRMRKLKKSFKKMFSRKPKESKKDMIQSINIVQEDETDYDKQWSRKVHKAASFAQPGAQSSEPASQSRASSANTTSSVDDDGIPVIFDAEEEIVL